jgi:uridine kinase
MKQVFGQLFSRVPEDTEHYDILNKVVTAFPLFPDIDPILVPQDSILREFIGGSSIKY